MTLIEDTDNPKELAQLSIKHPALSSDMNGYEYLIERTSMTPPAEMEYLNLKSKENTEFVENDWTPSINLMTRSNVSENNRDVEKQKRKPRKNILKAEVQINSFQIYQ